MYNHEPENYVCPFCNIGKDIYDHLTTADDIVYKNENTIAFIASRWWKNNKGHVLVIPRQHFENIYDISEEAICETEKTVKKVALAIKETYGCDGVSTRQHNEPAGDQDLWHYHVHIFPRYVGDELYRTHDYSNSEASERKPFADKLKKYFEEQIK